MLLELQEVPRKNYYHPRGIRGAIPTMKEKEKQGSSAVPTAAVPVPGTSGVFGVRFEQPSSPPPRISAVTSLPGHGSIRNTADPSPYRRLFVSRGPLSLRVDPEPSGAAPSSLPVPAANPDPRSCSDFCAGCSTNNRGPRRKSSATKREF
ncbi:hypothetical protein R3P38DRAFT_2775824 [Favolaschia claudopus]|uniref:Uncharacterized protein n=1 Tax=Favolaschia claudopus TaxID=2862362 RepID=A0AAW0BRW1_9AGAR